MDFTTLLKQRRSTRHFDPDAAISNEELHDLLAAAGLSPSGNNAQPWRCVVITDSAWREKLLPVAFNQQQVLTASAVILLLADREAYQAENLTRIHQEEYEDGCFNEAVRDFLTQAAIGFYQPFQETDTLKALALDCGLFAMNLMLAAENAGWQTVPMTGYQPALLREAFTIPDRYADIMLIAVGKGTQRGHRTLRRPVKELVYWNTIPD